MKNVSLYIDLAFCVIVLPVLAMMFPIERWAHNFTWYVACVGTWLYAAYFINRFVTVPCLFKWRRRLSAGLLLIVASFAVTALLAQVDLYAPKPSACDHNGVLRVFYPKIHPYQQAVWSLFTIVETFSFAVGLLTQANEQRMRRRAVEAERDRAEIELYKARIKPHFMFNTLNSLYGLFLTQSPNALTSLEKYISMLRYIQSSSERNLVPLADEVEYIRQYVAIQSLRLNEMTEVDMAIDVDDDSLTVPPMLLVTFVENCFKHGVSPVEPSRISIALTEHGGVMTLHTSNRIFPVKRIGEHMGIANCRKRLALLYPGRHSLDISNDGSDYKVQLTIELSGS